MDPSSTIEAAPLISLLFNYQLSPLIAFLAGSILSWGLLLLLIPILRRNLIDNPNSRSSHTSPTPRGGGLSFVIVGSLLAPLAGNTQLSRSLIISIPLALIGFLDDSFGISALFRFTAQLLTGIGLIEIASVPGRLWEHLLILTVIISIINFINFMDGIDGLAGSCCMVILAAAAFFPLLTLSTQTHQLLNYLWPLIGGIFGFLLWNWSPARVFMGDVGSTFLGAVVAGSVIQQPTLHSAVSLCLVGFPLYADAVSCIISRIFHGQPIFQAHKLHLYQRLHQSGWSHSQVTILYVSATVLLALMYLFSNIWLLIIVSVLELLVGLLLNRYAARPFTSNNISVTNLKS